MTPDEVRHVMGLVHEYGTWRAEVGRTSQLILSGGASSGVRLDRARAKQNASTLADLIEATLMDPHGVPCCCDRCAVLLR